MFGKSEWFAESNGKKILKPTEKKGWMYYGTWASVAVLPFFLLLVVSYLPQALIWLAAASAAFIFDYRRVLNSKQETEAYEKLFFIGDNVESSKSETENYELFIKE